ncbi:hypothetical protein GCM10009731_60930 [Streptomyces globosus]
MSGQRRLWRLLLTLPRTRELAEEFVRTVQVVLPANGSREFVFTHTEFGRLKHLAQEPRAALLPLHYVALSRMIRSSPTSNIAGSLRSGLSGRKSRSYVATLITIMRRQDMQSYVAELARLLASTHAEAAEYERVADELEATVLAQCLTLKWDGVSLRPADLRPLALEFLAGGDSHEHLLQAVRDWATLSPLDPSRRPWSPPTDDSSQRSQPALPATTGQERDAAGSPAALAEFEALPPEEQRRLASETAAHINETLAALFLRLGPPPTNPSGDFSPVTSGDGGARR